jgi:hypothetical protein
VALRHFDLIGYIVKAARVKTFSGIKHYFEGLELHNVENEEKWENIDRNLDHMSHSEDSDDELV